MRTKIIHGSRRVALLMLVYSQCDSGQGRFFTSSFVDKVKLTLDKHKSSDQCVLLSRSICFTQGGTVTQQ